MSNQLGGGGCEKERVRDREKDRERKREREREGEKASMLRSPDMQSPNTLELSMLQAFLLN